MKRVLTLAVLCVGLIFASCKKEEVASSDVAFMAMLSGSEEVPAVTTTATGMLDGVYNKDTKILTYTVTFTGVTPTAWHIHKAAKGANGGVIFNLGSTFTTPFKSATAALTAEQETDLMAGNYYVNIHSAKSPSGEIRGQLLKQ